MRGIDTIVIEKKFFPREKTCGDGLTPRSVTQLEAMGLGTFLKGKHRFIGLRAIAHSKSLEIEWPEHPDFPSFGYVVTRSELDEALALRSKEVGANYLHGVEATALNMEGDRIASVVCQSKDGGEKYLVRAKYFVVADGSNSRMARALGATRDRAEPVGLALRSYHYSPRDKDPWIESQLDLRDEDNKVIPGYGWIFPLGDGRVNVGFGLLNASSRWKSTNTTQALDSFIKQSPSYWGLSKASEASAPVGGKLPMGHSVHPKSGENFLLAGDAAASINPFNGEGIAYGYETGRLAADIISEAVLEDSPQRLRAYESELSLRYANYYRVATGFMKLMSEPRLLSPALWIAIRSPYTMIPVVKLMANLLKTDQKGVAERVYDAALLACKAVDFTSPLLRR